jgi:hypothetical protein
LITTPNIELSNTNDRPRETISLGVLHLEYYYRLKLYLYINNVDGGEDHELEGVLQEHKDHEVEAEELLDHREPGVTPID